MRGTTKAALVALLTCGATLGLALTGDPARWLNVLAAGAVVFVLMPWVMGTAMLLVTVPAVVLLLPLGLAASWLRPGGPTGTTELLGDLLRPGAAVVPGYYRTLGTVRSPILWGVVGGLLAATLSLALLVPAAYAAPA